MPRWGGDGCTVHCVPSSAGGCGEGSGAQGGEWAAESPALAHSSSLLWAPGRDGADPDFSSDPGEGGRTGGAQAVDHGHEGEDARA